MYVGKRSSHKSVNNPGRHLGFASKDINSERDANDSVRLTTEVPSRNQFNLPAEVRSEWNKMNIQKPLITKDTKLSDKVLDNRPSIPVPLPRIRELDLEVKSFHKYPFGPLMQLLDLGILLYTYIYAYAYRKGFLIAYLSIKHEDGVLLSGFIVQ